MKKNIILAINDVEPGLVNAVKKHSQRLGYKLSGLALVDKHYSKVKDRAKDSSELFKEILCDFEDRDQLQAALKPYIDTITAVICRQESAIHAYRKVVPFLPYINTPSQASLRWSTEKRMMRDRMRCFDPTIIPKYQYLEEYNEQELQFLLQELKFPVIVKPNGLAASILVTRCDNKIELDHCLKHTFEVIDKIYSRDLGRGRPSVLVEELIQGDMYSTDAYVTPEGKVYCLPLVKVVTADSIGLDGFYSYSLVAPVKLSKSEITKAEKAATSAIKALNLSSATAHVELFHTKDGWKIIELGPRIGGYREDIYREAYGIDHYYNELAIKMGIEPEMPTGPIGCAVGINIYPEAEGKITSITGLDRARKIPGVLFLDAHAKRGDLALYSSNGGRLIIDGVLGSKDPYQLEVDANQIRELIKINVS